MEQFIEFYSLSAGILGLVIILILWTMVWKGVALWEAAKHRQLGWYVALFLAPTLGILPMLYLFILNPAKKEDNIRGNPKED